MSQNPQDDLEWMAMRKKHQQEREDLSLRVEAEMQALYRRQEQDLGTFTRRVDVVKAELTEQNGQREGADGHVQRQKQPSTYTSASITAPNRTPIPTAEPVKDSSWSEVYEKPNLNSNSSSAAPATRQSVKQPRKGQPSIAPRQQNSAQRKQNAAVPRKGVATKTDVETIDLCSTDQDKLVEISEEDYRKKSATSTLRTTNAALTLPGGTSQKQTPKRPAPLVGPRNFQPFRLDIMHIDNAVAPKMTSVLDEKALATIPSSHSAVPALRTTCQNGSTSCHQGNNQARVAIVPSNSDLTRAYSDGDYDVEDVPLALLDIPVALAMLGATAYRSNRMDANTPRTESANCVTAKHLAQKTQLPSPSPTLTPAPSTPSTSEINSLLDNFRKPVFPTTLGVVQSQALTCSFVTARDEAKPRQKQSSSISGMSSSKPSRKRKQINLGDDEQCDDLQPPPLSHGAPKGTVTTANTLLKKPLKRKGFAKGPGGFPKPVIPSRSIAKRNKPSTSRTPPRTAPNPRGKELYVSPLTERQDSIRAKAAVQRMLEAVETMQADDETTGAHGRQSHRRGNGTELRTRLRSMSIKLAPTGKHSEKPMAVEEKGSRVKRPEEEGEKGQDRVANRMRGAANLTWDSDEDYADWDASDFFYVGGVILRKGQEGRLADG